MSAVVVGAVQSLGARRLPELEREARVGDDVGGGAYVRPSAANISRVRAS